MKSEPQTIDTIIHSFKHYALSDVIYNRHRAISGFILGICVIDQLSCFYYKGNSSDTQWENFVFKFMPDYAGKDIFKIFRNTVVHNYCGTSKFALCFDLDFPYPIKEIDGKWVISTHTFIRQLIRAFRMFEKEMREGKTDNCLYVLEWSKRHKVLTHNVIQVGKSAE